jgi:hypothetical protein
MLDTGTAVSHKRKPLQLKNVQYSSYSKAFIIQPVQKPRPSSFSLGLLRSRMATTSAIMSKESVVRDANSPKLPSIISKSLSSSLIQKTHSFLIFNPAFLFMSTNRRRHLRHLHQQSQQITQLFHDTNLTQLAGMMGHYISIRSAREKARGKERQLTALADFLLSLLQCSR